MKYISVSEAATKLNLSERSVRNYCASKRIKGAIQKGRTWLIPENVVKPDRSNSKDNEYDYEMIKDAEGLVDFLNASPVNYWAIKNSEDKLIKNGYVRLEENKPFSLHKGDKVFFTRNGTSIIALNIGEELNIPSFHVIASHSDSPCFKIKPACDGKTDIYNKINIEPYGGLIASTWLDRPLSIAGRVLVKTDSGLESKIINIDDNILMIPNLCIHFNRDINSGYRYDYATDMQAFIGQELEGEPLKELLCKHLDIHPNDLINFDLYLYNRMPAYIWGNKKEYISSPRLDDLECVYTSLEAFIKSNNKSSINVFYVSDNEEVGSSSRQGADSDFLDTILNRVCHSLDIDYQVALANSFLISADNAHAVHPNKPFVTDANNKAYMNKGIAIKFNASQSYTSDSISSAIFQEICEQSDVPYQFFANRSDLRGGSTLGNILITHTSLLAVDIGLPQLAMHSSFETAGSNDVFYAIKVFSRFYSVNIIIDGNKYQIK